MLFLSCISMGYIVQCTLKSELELAPAVDCTKKYLYFHYILRQIIFNQTKKQVSANYLQCLQILGHDLIIIHCSFLPPAYAVEVMFSLCLCVCLCVCLPVCLSVQAITFEPVDIEISFLVWCYILTISRSSLSVKVIGSRSSHGKC